VWTREGGTGGRSKVGGKALSTAARYVDEQNRPKKKSPGKIITRTGEAARKPDFVRSV
jgi:hypothetical protein